MRNRKVYITIKIKGLKINFFLKKVECITQLKINKNTEQKHEIF